MPITLVFYLCTALITSSLFAAPFFSFLQPKPIFTLMIDPAGDPQHAGRTVDTSFERGCTMQCAQSLKALLEERHANIRVVLTRFPGQSTQPLHNAHFANRLHVDCYLSIHCYQEKAVKSEITVYQFTYGDDFLTPTTDLTLYSYDKAYLINTPTTHKWCSTFNKVLTSPEYKQLFECSGVIKAPFKPLIGIQAPAVGIEIGLKKATDINAYIEPIAACVATIMLQ